MNNSRWILKSNLSIFIRFFSNNVETTNKKLHIKNNFVYAQRSSAQPENLKEMNSSYQCVSDDLVELHNKFIERSKTRWKQTKVLGEILYGVHPIQLALQCKKREFYQLYVHNKLSDSSDNPRKKIRDLAENLGIHIKDVKRNVLEKLATGHVHQGVCLDASKLSMENFDKSEENFDFTVSKSTILWLILDQITDPMNFGAMLRSSYYFGVDRVCIVKENSCKLTPVVSKASSGAMEVLPIYTINNLLSFLQIKKDQGWNIIGSKPNSNSNDFKYVSLDHEVLDVAKPNILILGSEGTGISKPVFDLCTKIITVHPRKLLIPGIDSLNVSVVCGIILHQLLGKEKKS